MNIRLGENFINPRTEYLDTGDTLNLNIDNSKLIIRVIDKETIEVSFEGPDIVSKLSISIPKVIKNGFDGLWHKG